MTEEEKKTLIDAVNCKYPHQNLTEIYYNISANSASPSSPVPNTTYLYFDMSVPLNTVVVLLVKKLHPPK